MPTNATPMVHSPLAKLSMGIGALLLATGVVAACLRWQENGWHGLLWLAMTLAITAIRVPHSLRNRANVVVEARKGADEKLLLGFMFLTMLILPLLQLATGLFDVANYALPLWASVVGAALQLPFLLLFWRSHADLGRNWSPGLEVHQEHSLVTNGVYRHIRHPMYAAIWIAALTQPLLIHNWIAGAAVIPAFAAMWLLRVPNEEALMRARFGAAYDAYAARTGRILPRLH